MTPLRAPLAELLGPIEPGTVPTSMQPAIHAIRRAGRRRQIIGGAINTIFYGCLLVVAIFFSWVYAEATDRVLPTKTTVEIVSPLVAPGSDLSLRIAPHMWKLCEGKAIFRAIDREGNLIHQSETKWTFPFNPGPDKPYLRKLRISRDAVASAVSGTGKTLPDAHLRIERKFFCNVIQKKLEWPIVDIMPDIDFSIGHLDSVRGG